MEDINEILSLKAVLQTALEKVAAMEKKIMNPHPISLKKLNHQARVDHRVNKRREQIAKNFLKTQNQ